MKIEVKVSVEVERTMGKFASREEIEEQILDAIEGADPGMISCDDGGEYEVVDWTVEVQPVGSKKARVV